MHILRPLVDFWIDGRFDVMHHPISYYKLSRAVRSAKKAVNESIEHGDSLEDVATVLATGLPRINGLGKVYQGGEPLPLPACMQSVETWANASKEEKAYQLIERWGDGPTRRGNVVNNLLSDLWTLLYDYGKVKGVNYEQVAQLVHQRMNS